MADENKEGTVLTELTDEQKALIDVVRDEWIDRAVGGDTSIDEANLRPFVDWLYDKGGFGPPNDIELYNSPHACVMRARELGIDVYSMDSIGLGHDSGWVAFYDYFCRIGLKEAVENEAFAKFRDFLKCGFWDCICLDELFICSRRPSMIRRDDQLRLHCEDGPAIKFTDWEQFFWHGRRVPEKLIMDPESYTSEEIQSENNSEVRRALAEKLGWDRFIEKMEMVSIDKWQDPNTGLNYELLDFKKRDGDLQPRILKMQSPVVEDGTQPWYVEPVDPHLKTAQAARKWQLPNAKGDWFDVDDCHKNPELKFEVET